MDHGHDHDHAHGHSHDHGHGHDHAHGEGDYYLNQLLTIFICGVFGVVGVLLYQTLGNSNGGMMGKLLAPQFQLPVLLGGAVLLVIVAVRGVCLWQAAGHTHDHHDHARDPHHGHDHKPGEACDHPDHAPDHEHGDHSAEDHEHGNVYWRVVILAFPVFLFAMGVPNKGFSARWIREYLGEETALNYVTTSAKEDKSKAARYSFVELNDLSKTESSRQSLTGSRVQLAGQFAPVPGRLDEFSLVFLKMTCCANDKEPLRARIVAKNESQISRYAKRDYPWVRISGILSQFVPNPKTGEWVAIIQIDDDGFVNDSDPMN